MANVLGLVSFRVFPSEMGGQKGVTLFYKHLAAHHHVVLACSENNEISDHHSLKIIPALFDNRKINLNVSRLKQIGKIIAQEKIDCIIAEHSFTGWMARWLARKHHLPFIIHSHNIEALRFRQMNRPWWKLYLAHEKWIHRQANFSFFISEEDRQFALDKFGLDRQKTTVITYGVDEVKQIENAGSKLRQQLAVGEEKLLYFNGTLDYAPNREAVENIITRVLPVLDEKRFAYKLLITGRRLPAGMEMLFQSHPSVLFKGFVADASLYYQGADVFMNPVINDAGVKTKLVEAVAYGCPVVSMASGAKGFRKELAGELFREVPDHEWKTFAQAVMEMCHSEKKPTPVGFWAYYSWKSIAANAAEKINQLTNA